MNTTKRLLLFIVLPIIAMLSYPLEFLSAGGMLLLGVSAFFALLGFWLWQGRSLALTFAIFLQGMNVIVRLMLFFANAIPKSGVLDVAYSITMLLGLALSFYLMLRLDQNDVRSTMVR